MTHQSPLHSKFLTSIATLVASVAVPTALAGVMTLSPATAEAAVEDATCRIHAVEASQEGDGGIPEDLDFLADQLQQPEFARYKTFTLLDTHDFKLEVGKVVDQKFKSGHNVELSLLGGEKQRLELHTKLKRSTKVLVDMDFVVKSNQIMLIPVRRGDAAIIFAYQCKS